MQVITRRFSGYGPARPFKIVPIGDVHIGPQSCDEKRLAAAVKAIADDPDTFWVGLGDYCDFINKSDKRFDSSILAPWLFTPEAFRDLAKAQIDKALDYLRPIAPKCLGLVCGNHESFIQQRYERDAYGEIVKGVREAGAFKEDDRLAFGYEGWLVLRFYRNTPDGQAKRGMNDPGSTDTVRIRLHHGYVGGRLAGAKALEMQRFLWVNDCHAAILGHSHNIDTITVEVESINAAGRLVRTPRKGVYGGSFLRTRLDAGPSTYSAVKGYLPLPVGQPTISLYPFAGEPWDLVKIAA